MIGETNPLILVFYIDRETISNVDFMEVFSESINQYVDKKGANIMTFFLPTDTEERVECINPTLLGKPDMERVNKLVDDIATQFDMKEPVDVKDYSFLNKGDCTYAFRRNWDYNGVEEIVDVIDKLAIQLEEASNRIVNQIRLHSCFESLINNMPLIKELNFNITYDDDIENNVIYVFSNDIFKLDTIQVYRNGSMVDCVISEATDNEIKEFKMRLWGYIKIENYEESDRV